MKRFALALALLLISATAGSVDWFIWDGATRTTNGGFATDTDWTKGTGWTIAAGVATKASGTASDIEQNQTVTNTVTYQTIFTISNITGGAIFVRLAGTAGTSRSTNGTFIENIVAGAGADPKLELVADASFAGDIDDVGVFANTGDVWEDAFTTIFKDWGATINPATDTVYVRSIHAETWDTEPGDLQGSTAEGATLRVNILSVVGAATGTTIGNLAVGASVTITDGSFNLDFNENFYIYGVAFSTDGPMRFGGGAGAGLFQTLEQSSITMTSTTVDRRILFGSTVPTNPFVVEFVETDIGFSRVGQGFEPKNGSLIWRGGILTGTAVTALFERTTDPFAGTYYLEGVDLSLLDAGEHLIGTGTNMDEASMYRLASVEVGTGFDWVDGTIDTEGIRIEAYYAEAGTKAAPALQIHFEDLHGELDEDIARTRTDGATDGTTAYTWTIDTTTNTRVQEVFEPFEGAPISFFATGDGTTKTWRFYGAAGTIPDDDEFWIRCQFPNSTETSSLSEFVTTRPDPLTTPVALASDEQATNGTFDTDTGWTKGTGWTISGGIASKASGTASDIEQNAADVITNGLTYEATYTVSGRTAGNIFTRIAGTAGTSRSTNATFTEALVAGAGADPKIEFVADSSFDGDIDNVVVTSEWAGSDVAGKFRIDVQGAPDKDGLWTCTPYLALDNERVSLDPRPRQQ